MIKNEGNVKNFWNGFIAGSVMAGACLYAFGTKNGRNSIRTLLEFSENMDTNIHKLFKHTKNKSSSDTVPSILEKIRYVSKHA